MKRLIFIFIVLFCFGKLIGATRPLEKQLNVLVVTDNRKFNREAFFAMFDSFQDIRLAEISHPEILDFFGTDSIRSFDAIVFYDMPEQVILTDTQKQNFLKFFEEGAPAIFLHHSLLSYRQWEQFPEIIGGRYYNKSPLITDQGDTLQSVYQHDVRHKVSIVNAEHPITLGMDDFEILDEVYNHYYVKDDVEVLLTTDHHLSGRKLGWVNTFGNSRIVFLINGHNETAYENPNFRKLLYNAIQWTASQKKRKKSSFAKSNFKGTFEVGYLKANHISEPNFTHARVKLNLIAGYQFNPYFSLGVGSGLRYYLPELWPVVPLFANFTVRNPKEKISPFLSLNVGHTFDLGHDIDPVGFLLDPSLGIKIKTSGRISLNLAINYEMHFISNYHTPYKELGPVCILLGISI